MQIVKTTLMKNNKKTPNSNFAAVDRYEELSKRNAELEAAIKTVLRYISSNQVYDKDAKGVLLRALESEAA